MRPELLEKSALSRSERRCRSVRGLLWRERPRLQAVVLDMDQFRSEAAHFIGAILRGILAPAGMAGQAVDGIDLDTRIGEAGKRPKCGERKRFDGGEDDGAIRVTGNLQGGPAGRRVALEEIVVDDVEIVAVGEQRFGEVAIAHDTLLSQEECALRPDLRLGRIKEDIGAKPALAQHGATAGDILRESAQIGPPWVPGADPLACLEVTAGALRVPPCRETHGCRRE